MNVVHIDTDITGHSSVLDLIQAGQLVSYPCRTLQETAGVAWALLQGQIKADLVVLDTITNLANKAVQDSVIPPDQRRTTPFPANLADLVPGRSDWQKSGNGIVAIIRPLMELQVPIIFVAHERSREDPMSGQDKVAPDAQGMVLSNLICNADAIIRLKRTMLPLQIGETIYPAGTRQLLIAEGPSSVDCAIGGRAWPPLPEYILEPTLEKFIAAYHGALPHNIVLYGAPKVGKTTFATGADRYKQLAT